MLTTKRRLEYGLLCFLGIGSNAFVLDHRRPQQHHPFLTNSLKPMKIVPSSSTVLFIEDWVADMIDDELHRQYHKEEYERALAEKNRAELLHQIQKEHAGDEIHMSLAEDDEMDKRQLIKDRKLAMQDPQRYCADRCVSTGNCDVYEDFFQFSPNEVMEFCNDCVLSNDDEPCDIPDAFYGEEDTTDGGAPQVSP